MDSDEQIKWRNTLDAVALEGLEEAMLLARACNHPDAVWFCSLFPAGVPVTDRDMVDVMRQHGDDPRALLLLWKAEHVIELLPHSNALLLRAAEMGYAPAQADAALELFLEPGGEGFRWAERAAAAGDRRGMFALAQHLSEGRGCESDGGKAFELYRDAARSGDACAQFAYGRRGFELLDWERYHWYALAARAGNSDAVIALTDATVLIPLFESGELARILHIVGPVFRAHVTNRVSFRLCVGDSFLEQYQRVIALYDAMAERAKEAMRCWSVIGRRVGLVKDVRVMIAKMLWEEAWQWSEDKKGAATAKAEEL
jgi:TPR repeat protein